MIGSNFKIPQQIAERVAHVLAIKNMPKDYDFLEVINELQHLTGIFDGCSNTFYYQEYEIMVGKVLWVQNIAQTLTKMRNLSLSIMPELVSEFPVNEGCSVLVSRYSACAGEELLHLNKLETAFDENAVQRFRYEIQTLADNRLVHSYIRGGVYWLVCNKTGTIVLTNWHTLENADPIECAYMLQTIEHVFNWQLFLSPKLNSK